MASILQEPTREASSERSAINTDEAGLPAAGFAQARQDVWTHALAMWQAGLVVGSAGNVSSRIDAAHIAITPASIPYPEMKAEDVVVVHLDSGQVVQSRLAPSSELPMHLAVYAARPDVGAVVHTHSPYVATLSVLRRSLPPVIDEMAVYLGGTIEVTDYAFTGTSEVGANVLRVLGDRAGVILANHGNVCIGGDLRQALHAAVVMESCARVYVQALQIGEPVSLPASSLAAGRRLFDARRSRSR